MELRKEPEGRPGGPGVLKTARGAYSLALLPLVVPPGLPSGSLGSQELPEAIFAAVKLASDIVHSMMQRCSILQVVRCLLVGFGQGE